MQLAGVSPGGSQALDGEHALAVNPARGPDAGAHCPAVQQDDARAAQPVAAADLGPDQAQVVTQHIGQCGLGGQLNLVLDPVDDQGYVLRRQDNLFLIAEDLGEKKLADVLKNNASWNT